MYKTSDRLQVGLVFSLISICARTPARLRLLDPKKVSNEPRSEWWNMVGRAGFRWYIIYSVQCEEVVAIAKTNFRVTILSLIAYFSLLAIICSRLCRSHCSLLLDFFFFSLVYGSLINCKFDMLTGQAVCQLYNIVRRSSLVYIYLSSYIQTNTISSQSVSHGHWILSHRHHF